MIGQYERRLEQTSILWARIDLNHTTIHFCDKFAGSKANTYTRCNRLRFHSLETKKLMDMFNIFLRNAFTFISDRQNNFVIIWWWLKYRIFEMASFDEVDRFELSLRVVKLIIKWLFFHLIPLQFLDIQIVFIEVILTNALDKVNGYFYLTTVLAIF